MAKKASNIKDLGDFAGGRPSERPLERRSTALELAQDAGRQLKNPVAQYLARLPSDHSKRTMLLGLRTCLDLWFKGREHEPAEAFPWWEARYEHTNLIRAALQAGYGPATANVYLAALRGVLKECWRLRLMTWEEYGAAGSKEALPAIKGSDPDAGRCLSRAEQAALLRACDADPGLAGRRDAAALAVLLDAGLRRAELAALDVADLDARLNLVTVRRGKGRKSRAVPMTDRVRRLTAAWVAAAGLRRGPLFVPVNRAGKAVPRRATGRFVATLLARRAARAKVADVSPHDTRRTFATDLDAAGVGLEGIRDLLGHASIETTRRYLKRGEQAKAGAIAQLEAWRNDKEGTR